MTIPNSRATGVRFADSRVYAYVVPLVLSSLFVFHQVFQAIRSCRGLAPVFIPGASELEKLVAPAEAWATEACNMLKIKVWAVPQVLCCELMLQPPSGRKSRDGGGVPDWRARCVPPCRQSLQLSLGSRQLAEPGPKDPFIVSILVMSFRNSR